LGKERNPGNGGYTGVNGENGENRQTTTYLERKESGESFAL